MVGTFQELVKNPRMQKFLKSKKEDSQAESSQHAVKRKQEQIPEKLEHAEKTPIVAAGPMQEATLAQDPAVNGQGSNAQQVLPAISPLTAAQPGYFGGGSFQAMARQPTSFPGFMPRGSPGMMPADAVNPLYASLGTLPGFHTTYSPVLMPAVPTTMAGHPHLSEPVTAKTGEISAEKAAKDLPFLMPPVYDHLCNYLV